MAEALFEFEDILISRKEILTSEEDKLLNSWKQNAVRNFGIGATGASIATWLVTRRLNNLIHMNLTVLVSFMALRDLLSVWILKLNNSLSAWDSYANWVGRNDNPWKQFLAERQDKPTYNRPLWSDPSPYPRIARALVMLKKYQHDPQVLRHVSKYFFCENVYDDDSTDQPKPRWRIRNLFEEDLASAHMTCDDDSYYKKINSEETDMRKTNQQRKQINMSAAADFLEANEDPFDCIFGSSASVQDIHHPDTFSTPPRRRNYNQKRSHRRHRLRHKENMDV